MCAAGGAALRCSAACHMPPTCTPFEGLSSPQAPARARCKHACKQGRLAQMKAGCPLGSRSPLQRAMHAEVQHQAQHLARRCTRCTHAGARLTTSWVGQQGRQAPCLLHGGAAHGCPAGGLDLCRRRLAQAQAHGATPPPFVRGRRQGAALFASHPMEQHWLAAACSSAQLSRSACHAHAPHGTLHFAL